MASGEQGLRRADDWLNLLPRYKPSLDAAYRRVQRGHDHLIELEELCEETANEWARKWVEMLGGPHTTDTIAEYFTNDGRTPRPNIPPMIPILAGEVAYNFRAALDYAVGQLSRLRIPVRRGDPKRRNQFPIERSAANFAKRRDNWLRGLTDWDVELLKDFQPFRGCTWTATLGALSNIDKHNNLIRVRQAVTIRIDGTTDDSPHVKMTIDPFFDLAFRKRLPLISTLQLIEMSVTVFLDSRKRLFERSPHVQIAHEGPES